MADGPVNGRVAAPSKYVLTPGVVASQHRKLDLTYAVARLDRGPLMQNDEAKQAGRGVVWITGAKGYFLLTGFAVQFALPHLMRNPVEYGRYAAAINAVSIINNVMIAATVQGVSRFVSTNETRAGAVLRTSLIYQLFTGLALALGFGLSASWVASGVLLNPSLTPLLQVAAVIIAAYALYATFVGFLNGRRFFGVQAGLDATFTTVRSGGLVLGAFVAGAAGAVNAFAMAAVLIAILGAATAASRTEGLARGTPGIPLRDWAMFLGPVAAYQYLLNVMLQGDVWVIQRTVVELSMQAGQTAAAAAEASSKLVAFYSAAQRFAFVPYQLLLAVTFVLFPLVSRATSVGDRDKAGEYIRNAMRFSLIVLCGLCAPIAGASRGVMRLAFPAAYIEGAGALSWLVGAIALLAVFVILASILSGAGRPLPVALIALGGCAVMIVTVRTLMLSSPVGPKALTGAAMGTLAGTATATAAASLLVYKLFGPFLSWRTLVRLGVATTGAILAGLSIDPGSKLLALASVALSGVTYLLLILVTREITGADLGRLRGLVRK